ncbi:MAG: hypothetical protein ACPGYP_04140 [Solirubrobacterales bacterium]
MGSGMGDSRMVAAASSSRIAVALAIVVIGGVFVLGNETPRAAGTFAPTIAIETSTTRATAHPDARITIDNTASDELLRDLTIDLPDGMMGSLNAAEPCTTVDAAAADCGSSAVVGTVTNDATVDKSDVRLRGTVYLTEPLNSTDPAGLQIVVPAVIGGVDMGEVVVNARVQTRHAIPDGVTPPTGAVGKLVGITTTVTDIPRDITDTHGRTVEFTLKRLIVDLKSNQVTPYSPLLTNASACSTKPIAATATSYDDTDVEISDDYTVDACDTVKYDNPSLNFLQTSTTAGDDIGLTTEIEFPDDQASTGTLQLNLSGLLGINTGNVGDSTFDQCPASSIVTSLGFSTFSPSACPPQAVAGSVVIETPMLADPVEGDIYLISKSPIPNLGVFIDETTGPNNPQGVTIALAITTSTPLLSPCDIFLSPFFTCPPVAIQALANGIPDVPVKKMTVTMDGPDRTDYMSNPLSSKILTLPAAGDPSCQAADDPVAVMASNAGMTVLTHAVGTVTATGCNARSVAMTGSPYGEVTSDTTPDLPFVTGVGAPYCAVDQVNNYANCSSPFTPGTALTKGVHRFFVGGTEDNWRAFVVSPATTPDTTAPTTTIDTGPTGTTSDTTPEWTFSANEDSDFQCAVDDGPFLPCDAGAPLATTGSFTVDDPHRFFAGTSHKFEVRAQDEAGNVGAAVEANINIEIAFAPSLTTNVTTTHARAHPNLDLTISSLSNEDVKSVGISLPDGFFGGLTGVQSLCPLATAAAGNCTAASRAGTVETEARVGDSLVRIDGEVFLTESAHAGEPAGLSIKVPAVIQDVDLGDIIVAGRLLVRGQAQGVDSLVVEIPKEIDPADSGNTFDSVTEFDMRKITLKLRTGPGATYPLLTNPSSCNGSAFIAYFNGYANSSTADANAFASTGCTALPFSPRIAMSVVDSTSGKPPVNGSASDPVSANLTAVLSSNPGYAGIQNVSILMPKPLTINVLEIPPACEVAQYANGAGQCPATSIVGSVSAISPLLPEPLGGSVYLLKQSNPAKATPRLLIALRGRINVDIIADNSFVNGTQILTTLNGLPDVPLSSFTINVDRVLSTRNEACTVSSDEWNAVGNMTDFSGRTAPINQHLVFGCEPKYSFRYRNRGDRSFLNVEAIGGPKEMRKLTVRLPHGVRIVKKNVKRKLVVIADGKRLSRRCYNVARATLTLRLCGRDVSTLRAEFRRGSLTTNRKAVPNKRVKRLSLWGVDRELERIRFKR